MKPTRTTSLVLAVAAVAVCHADTSSNSLVPPDLTLAAQVPVVSDIFAKPRFGIRVGGGTWNQFVIDGGVDVTMKVPILPIPAIRLDGEVWGKPSNFGKDTRGNAVSLLGVQNIAMGYYGVGPTFYFADNNGDHHSGFGAKVLGGITLPHGLYAEAGWLIGPSPAPIFVTIGQSF